MPNKNEYIADGKTWLVKIKYCCVIKKCGTRYTLTCRIHQRGLNDYTYEPAEECLVKGKIRLFLTGNSFSTVRRAVDGFEEQLKRAFSEDGDYYSVPFPDVGINLHYRQTGEDLFAAFYEITETNSIIAVSERPLRELLTSLPLSIFDDRFGKQAHPDQWEDYREHPLYRAAEKNGDTAMTMLFDLYFGEKKEAAKALSRKYRKRLILKADKEYDKYYYLSMKDVQIDILLKSGYRYLHRPYFAMQNSTHEMISVNPHQMDAVDAAPVNAVPISWQEFMDRFGTTPE